MRRVFFLCFLVLTATASLAAEPAEVDRILGRFKEKRPDARQLAMYRLDWADSIGTALERSRAEGRPVMLIVIHARYGDITTGHC
jgi:hypothetical protein